MEIVLAKSKAGHDKNSVYVIVGYEKDFVFLANGKTKLIAEPKKKKKIHVQQIYNLPNEVVEEVKSIDHLDDLSIEKILSIYNRRNKDV